MMSNVESNPKGFKSDGISYRVMVVDDSIFVVKQMQYILESESYEVVAIAHNGVEAIHKYKEHYPNIDLVTMDITMPKLDGLTALQKIIEFDKDAHIIVISAIGKQSIVREALLCGAKNYITKPIRRDEVLKRIRNVLN